MARDGGVEIPKPGSSGASIDAVTNGRGTWSQVAPMPTARTYLAVCAVNGILYAVGGTDKRGEVFNTLEAFDPTTNSWMTKVE